MSTQNLKNHVRFVPGYHFLASTTILFALVGATYNLYKAYVGAGGRVLAATLLLAVFSLLLVYWFCRVFALKAQDRAIRAEENFRHYLATGKPLDNRLRIGQIIALRFAGDDEFVALAKRAADENLSSKDIKAAIVNWKGDYYRA